MSDEIEVEVEPKRRPLNRWLVDFQEHEGMVMDEDGGNEKKCLTWTAIVYDNAVGNERFMSPHRIMNFSEARSWASNIMTNEVERQRLRTTAKKSSIILPGG